MTVSLSNYCKLLPEHTMKRQQLHQAVVTWSMYQAHTSILKYSAFLEMDCLLNWTKSRNYPNESTSGSDCFEHRFRFMAVRGRYEGNPTCMDADVSTKLMPP